MKIRATFHTHIHTFLLYDGKDWFIHVIVIFDNTDITLNINTLKTYFPKVLPQIFPYLFGNAYAIIPIRRIWRLGD